MTRLIINFDSSHNNDSNDSEIIKTNVVFNLEPYQRPRAMSAVWCWDFGQEEAVKIADAMWASWLGLRIIFGVPCRGYGRAAIFTNVMVRYSFI